MTQINNPLIVPMAVEALVVNDKVRENSNDFAAFVRAQMKYDQLQNATTGLGNAQPVTADTDSNFTSSGMVGNTNVSASDFYNGVYLKWRLPKAFTNGEHSSANNNTVYPQVPNRWMVVRYSGANLASRSVMAWIIESDYVWPVVPTSQNASQLTTNYLADQLQNGQTQQIAIGRSTILSGTTWSESGNSLKLTAMGPGNPAFAAYQPQCNNVFSFVDCLNGQPAETLSYAVYGWYSDASDDPLANPQGLDFADLISNLGWVLPKTTSDGETADCCMVCGTVNGVQWQTAAMPPGGVPSTQNGQCPISIAVGNNSIEALTALITTQDKSISPELLNAFQLDLAEIFDLPDGQAELNEKLKASFYQKYSGGYTWVIVDAPGASTPVTVAELALEQPWLIALNKAQVNLDAAILTLAELQQTMYVMWWKSLQPYLTVTKIINHVPTPVPANPEQPKPEYFSQQLDPNYNGSLAWQVNQQLDTVNNLLALVPSGSTPTDLQAAIASYAEKQNLLITRQLKRQTDNHFYLPNEPVVLMTGMGASSISQTPAEVQCRFSDQLVTGFTFEKQNITASTSGLIIPQPDLSGVSGVPWSVSLIKSLLTEFFFLDPNNAAALNAAVAGSGNTRVSDTNVIGVLPDSVTGQSWSQNPWRPLLLYWQANYYPIAYGTTASPNWTFNGTYTWNGQNVSVGTTRNLSGMIQLAPTAAQNLDSRIDAFLTNTPNLTQAEITAFQDLQTFIKQQKEGDLLSQMLDGFNSQIQLSLPGIFLSPSVGEVSDLIGNSVTKPPLLLGVDGSGKPYPSNFQPWRSGQFQFTSLVVVDEWGQALWPINSQNKKTESLFIPSDLTPAYLAPDNPSGSVLSGNAPPNTGSYRIQLSPAILEPALLDFSMISASNDAIVSGPLNPNANPICGWVLPNHLDASLMAFDAEGYALGEMFIDADGSMAWNAFPNCPAGLETLQNISASLPHFGPFLLTLFGQKTNVFTDFMQAIDETIWTTVPTGSHFDNNLSILMGRPLAMIRSKLQFLLNGKPNLDPSWQFTSAPAVSPLPGYTFGIELGNIEMLNDGLIGYFEQDNYGEFNIVAEANGSSDGYLNTIGVNNNYIYLPFDGQTSSYVSMLIDPRASIHATTEILPVKAIELPPDFVAEALSNINFAFRNDGLLTDSTTDLSNNITLLMPVPREMNGTWTWAESDQAGWTTYSITDNDPGARLADVLPVIRRGYMQSSPVYKTKKP